MSLTKYLISEINRLNVSKSSGPRTDRGKQRSRLNAVKHNLSGQHLILQESEVEAYNRMSASMLNDLNPKSEPERQIAQKIIDINFRLNRLTAIENNLFTFGFAASEKDNDNDDRIEIMGAQTRAWTERASTFDVIGRYEARLSRQLLQYQKEFERLQTVRKDQEFRDRHKSAEEMEQDKFDPSSFRQAENSWRILTYLPPPKGAQTTDPCTAGDLVTGDFGKTPPIPMQA